MCDGQVGNEIAQWLIDNYPGDIRAVVTVSENQSYSAARSRGIPSLTYKSEPELLQALATVEPIDLGVLAWWPKIISPALIAMPEYGFINTHPSLLPYNRGKHYNFWALVEQVPFGVSLHYVDEGIDSGDVVAQSLIPYDWEDTGETLYAKAGHTMVDLFKAVYPKLRAQELPRIKQCLSWGSLHYASEIEPASKVDLDKTYRARDLINLLRARTFSGHPACWFEDDGATYEIRIEIRRKQL